MNAKEYGIKRRAKTFKQHKYIIPMNFSWNLAKLETVLQHLAGQKRFNNGYNGQDRTYWAEL
jgi:hypothetical protein